MQIDIQQSTLHENVKTITDENLHESHPLIQEAYLYVKANPDKIFFPRKFYGLQKMKIEAKVKQLAKSSPLLSSKNVLMKILKTLPETVPADKLTELLKFAAAEWQKHQVPASQSPANISKPNEARSAARSSVSV